MVDDLVPGGAQVVLQFLAQLEARVVGRDVDAHATSLRFPQAKIGSRVRERLSSKNPS